MRTTFEFLKDQKGVCRDYAEFAKVLFNYCGIECECISGISHIDGEGHEFNIVTIDEKKYWLDMTWVAQELQMGIISSLEESNNFLTSNEYFVPGHDEYLGQIINLCHNYDREEIKKSINKVLNWGKNYRISFNVIKDLFKKYRSEAPELKKSIETAIPGRK